MGLIGRILGGPSATTALGQAATGVAEVFRPNATKKMQAAHDAYMAALGEYGTEFQYVGDGIFDSWLAETPKHRALALYFRYLKRIHSHLRNVATSVYRPFHKIGFVSKKVKRRAQADALSVSFAQRPG